MPFKNENNLSYVNMGNGAYICLAFAHKRCRSVARALPSSSAVIDIYLSNVDLSRCVVASSQTVCLAFARIAEIACDHNRHFATIYDRRKTIYIYIHVIHQCFKRVRQKRDVVDGARALAGCDRALCASLKIASRIVHI